MKIRIKITTLKNYKVYHFYHAGIVDKHLYTYLIYTDGSIKYLPL